MKTHTCYLKILSRKYATMEFGKGVHGVFRKETVEKDDEQSQKFKGKLKKDLKTAPIFAKHAFFTTEVSRQRVARSKIGRAHV